MSRPFVLLAAVVVAGVAVLRRYSNTQVHRLNQRSSREAEQR